MKSLVILGSTGSIGLAALDVARQHPDKYRIIGLAAGSNQAQLFAQAREFGVQQLALANEPQGQPAGVKLINGQQAACELIRNTQPDMVLNGISGAAGFLPSLTAIENGCDLALANKESLVIGGSLLIEAARRQNVRILPVDSEHSAIFQCQQGEPPNSVRRLILTASGGPFRTTPQADFAGITPAMALKHPTWNMGQRITIDSATMMNKALEIIEAAWLFNLPTERIDVVVHPSSIVHSLVEFNDKSIKAQLGYPDMRLPIAYALSWPERPALDLEPLNLRDALCLEFFPPDEAKFPALGLARLAMQRPATLPCVLNAADEVAVAAFLNREIRFDQIADLVEKTMHKLADATAASPQELIELDRLARQTAKELIR